MKTIYIQIGYLIYHEIMTRACYVIGLNRKVLQKDRIDRSQVKMGAVSIRRTPMKVKK